MGRGGSAGRSRGGCFRRVARATGGRDWKEGGKAGRVEVASKTWLKRILGLPPI